MEVHTFTTLPLATIIRNADNFKIYTCLALIMIVARNNCFIDVIVCRRLYVCTHYSEINDNGSLSLLVK